MSGQIYSLFHKLALLISIYVFVTPSFAAEPKVYVGNADGNSISVIDSSTNKVLNTIAIPLELAGMSITPDGKFVYVADSGANIISVIDTVTDKVVGNIEVGADPQGMVITNDGKFMLAASQGANAVVYIDTANNKVIDVLAIPSVNNLALNSTNTIAVAGSQDADKPALVEIDVGKRAIVNNVPLKRAPRDLQFGPGDKYLYFTQAGIDAVNVMDTATHKIIKQIPTGPSPHPIVFTHDGKRGLIASQDAGMVYLFDPQNNIITDKIAVGKQPYWIVISSDDRLAYITNEHSNTVSVIDLLTKEVIQTISVGHGPHKIVMQQGTITVPPSITSHPNVTITYDFSPDTIVIKAGQTVVWKNSDMFTHKIESNDHTIDSHDLSRGASYSKKFDKPGTYDYHCAIHDCILGKVIVR